MTGQDSIVCRPMYGAYFEYEPQFKVLMATNHKPTIRGDDEAIWRRMRLIPFTATFTGNKADKGLFEKLSAEFPGILSWALEGLKRYQAEGLRVPRSIAQLTDEYRSDMDIIGEWIADCCVEGPDHRCPMAEIYTSYRSWCQASGHYPMAKRRLGQRLRNRGIDAARNGRMRFYVGITVVKPNQPDLRDTVVIGPFPT